MGFNDAPGSKGHEELATTIFYLGEDGSHGVSTEIKKLPDGSVRFTKDIKSSPAKGELSSLMDVSELEILKNAGLFESGKGRFELGDDEGNPGFVEISKEAINEAIESGRLHVKLDEEGELNIEG